MAPSASTSKTGAASGAADALRALDSLEVKGRAPRTGYTRGEFGQAWADTDRNGCDTRNDILRRDLLDVALDERMRGCVVLAGTLDDPFSGRLVPFVRGERSDEVQIDHVVALSDAWQKGAGLWSAAARETFANDPLNLLAVDGGLNAQKGDGDAATWLPPSRPYRCAYAARQIAVKARYALWVTPSESDALRRILGTCPDVALPTGAGLPTRDDAPVAVDAPIAVDAPAAPSPPAEAPSAPDSGVASTDPRFATCSVLPSGYGPYVSGADPEYAWYRDADADGTVCER